VGIFLILLLKFCLQAGEFFSFLLRTYYFPTGFILNTLCHFFIALIAVEEVIKTLTFIVLVIGHFKFYIGPIGFLNMLFYSANFFNESIRRFPISTNAIPTVADTRPFKIDRHYAVPPCKARIVVWNSAQLFHLLLP